ncbi:EF hand [Trichuris suis]|nr:EF hand [Trichuris suis]
MTYLLIKIFATEFRGDDFAAAQNFYSVIPALTLNFADHCLVYKEGFQHYYENVMSFTDDGFAVGTAFLLNILGQFDHFASLRWFTSVSSKISSDKKLLMEEVLSATDKTLHQTVSFRIRRKEEFEQELIKVSDALTSSLAMFPEKLQEQDQCQGSQGGASKEGSTKRKTIKEKADVREGPPDHRVKETKQSSKNPCSEESAPTFTEPDMTDYDTSDRICNLTDKEKKNVKNLPRLSRKDRHKYRCAFRLFDKNHDGKVTAAELAAGMQALNQKFTNEEAANMVHRYAENSKQVIR